MRNFIWRWAIPLMVWGACFLVSMEAFPLPWQDEVHIVEMGRSCLGDMSSAFAITANGTNFCPFYFIGPGIQELSYRWLGACGPRISSMLGLLVLACLCFIWTRQRWHDARLSCLSFWLVLLNALLVHSARLVRVDTWAFPLLFLSVIILRLRSIPSGRVRFLLAGLLAGINLFVWPSAFLFETFLLFEFWSIWQGGKTPTRERLVDCASAAIGVLLAGTVCLLLTPAGILETLSSYFTTVDGTSRVQLGLIHVLSGSVIVWGKEILRDPFFFALATVGVFALICRRRFFALLLGLACFVAMIPSGLHTYRFLYLWPFLIYLSLEGVHILFKYVPRLARVGVSLVIAVSAVTGSLAYAVVAIVCPRPDAEIIERRLAESVGKGAEQIVYSLSFQPYYAGRSLGWIQYRHADVMEVFSDAATNLLEKVNTVIVPIEQDYYAAEESFTPFGALRNGVIHLARMDAKNGTDSPLGKIGASLAFHSVDAQVLSCFERRLTELGFVRSSVVSFEDWRYRVPGWFAAIEPLIQSVRGYDDLVVWRRK